MVKFIIVFCALLLFSTTAYGEISSLPFETTMDCAEWEGPSSTNPFPAGITWMEDSFDYTCSDGQYEQITIDANMAAGAGGRGIRHWVGGGKNDNSNAITFNIPNSNEIWVRWYMRYSEAFSWSQGSAHQKFCRVSGSGGGDYLVGWNYGRVILAINGVTVYSDGVKTYWETYFTDGDHYGNDEWVLCEVHLKYDAGSSGVFEFWFNGDKVADFTNVNFSAGGNFDEFGFGKNQDYVAHSDCTYNDYDDVAISTTGYIGPINQAICADNPNGCTTQSDCEAAGWNWCTNLCQQNACPSEEGSGEEILFENWEANNFENWDDDFIQGDTHIDTTPVYDGNYAIKMESTNQGNYAHFFGDHPGVDKNMVTDVSVETYIYPSEDFQWPSSDMKLWIMNCFEAWDAGYNTAEGQGKPHSWAPYYMTISVNNNGQPFGQLTRADGLGETGDLWHNYWQNSGAPLALIPGTWNKLKYRLKLNSLGNSDGIFQLWVNNELVCDYSNMNFRGNYSNYGWNHLMMSMHANPSHPKSQWITRDNIYIFSGVALKPSAPALFK